MLSDRLPTLRARKKAATKERLYAAALDLFRRQGFAATTIAAIAEAAEVSRGTFFNYFPGKAALRHYLSARLAAATAEALAAALPAEQPSPGLSVRARLNRLGPALAATVEADRELTRVAVFERLKAPADGGADPYQHLLRQAVAELLREGQSRGEVTPGLDLDLWSGVIAGLYFQQILEWCAATSPYPLAERLERLLAGLWHGLSLEQPA